MQKRRQEDSEQEGKDDSKESVCSRYHRTDAHKNSQTVAAGTGSAQAQAREVPSTETGSGHRLSPLSKMLSTTGIHLERKY